MAVEAQALARPYQVAYRAGENEGVADTCKAGVGGSAGLRPHELLEAALATCMTITARMALADLGVEGIGEAEGRVSVQVTLERGETVTDFRYELTLDPVLEAYRAAVQERLRRSPVRTTLSKELRFTPL